MAPRPRAMTMQTKKDNGGGGAESDVVPVPGVALEGLWNDEIDTYCRKLGVKGLMKTGPIDEMVVRPARFPSAQVVNYSSSTEQGTHWVAI